VKKQSRFEAGINPHEASERRFSGECGPDVAVGPRRVGKMPCMGAARPFLGCILLIGLGLNAHAQELGAKLALDKARKECRAARGLKLTVEPEAIRSIDLNGDGRADAIVDYSHVTCERRPEIFCGTGGCPLAIVVALPGGKYREVFRQQVLRYVIEPGEGARTIRFDLHGTRCGKTGPEPCSKRQTIGTTRFEFREP
jgi:hypothetical protein